MDTLENLREQHPDWTEDNLIRLSCIKDRFDQVWAEVLLSNPCVKCRREIGEHSFVAYKFYCPDHLP